MVSLNLWLSGAVSSIEKPSPSVYTGGGISINGSNDSDKRLIFLPSSFLSFLLGEVLAASDKDIFDSPNLLDTSACAKTII